MIILECSADIEKPEEVGSLCSAAVTPGRCLFTQHHVTRFPVAAHGLGCDRGVSHCDDADRVSAEVLWNWIRGVVTQERASGHGAGNHRLGHTCRFRCQEERGGWSWVHWSLALMPTAPF